MSWKSEKQRHQLASRGIKTKGLRSHSTTIINPGKESKIFKFKIKCPKCKKTDFQITDSDSAFDTWIDNLICRNCGQEIMVQGNNGPDYFIKTTTVRRY